MESYTDLDLQLEFVSIFRNKQGRSEGILSAIFEVLIINCQIDSINWFISTCLTSDINFLIFNCLTSLFVFRKQIFRKQKRTAVYGRDSLVSDFKRIRDNEDLLSSRHK